jgi:SAM-dependent methyltransferase
MKPGLIPLLACPECGRSLKLSNPEPDPTCADEIASGTLVCEGCAAEFEIRGGVPRLLPRQMPTVVEKTSAAFGWQWREFVELYDEYEPQFLDWIHPIQPEFFKDKVVLDAGCGNGRHAFYAARYGSRPVVAMDLSDAVDTAYENMGKLPNAHVVQGDIYHPPFARRQDGGPFDFIYSIGVLHHLPDPEAGFQSLVRFLKPGGAIFAWVYGHENNRVVHSFINPLRENVTTHIPPRMLPVIAWPMSVALHAVVKGVYRPLHRTRAFNVLPSRDYLYSLSSFSFRRNYNIVFDHLVAPVAAYLKRDEFEGWFQRSQLRDVRISWRNQNSWRGFGRVAD